eukprot:m.7451 g.7451  ORF g.7451 m.7451 type:complete len:72 (-) comp5253_c0_seq1:42-257(-)
MRSHLCHKRSSSNASITQTYSHLHSDITMLHVSCNSQNSPGVTVTGTERNNTVDHRAFCCADAANGVECCG